MEPPESLLKIRLNSELGYVFIISVYFCLGMTEMNPSSDVFGWKILFATFFGPILAVIVTRITDRRREQRDRQKAIFRTLMSNRVTRLNPETVQSLNLIEIEFSADRKIVSAWHDYFAHLNTEIPLDQNRIQEFLSKRNNLYVLLLDKIARSPGYKIDQLSILDGGYYPTAAVQAETDNQAVRQLFAEIARGERSLAVNIENIPKEK